MRIDGFSSSSYPVKRTPRKAPVRDEGLEDAELVDEAEVSQPARASSRPGSLPARQQDMVHPRACDRRTAAALASYLSTAGFIDWEMEVLGLDLYV